MGIIGVREIRAVVHEELLEQKTDEEEVVEEIEAGGEKWRTRKGRTLKEEQTIRCGEGEGGGEKQRENTSPAAMSRIA